MLSISLFFFLVEYSDIVNRQYAKKNKHNTVGHHSILLARAVILKRMNLNVKHTNANSGSSQFLKLFNKRGRRKERYFIIIFV